MTQVLLSSCLFVVNLVFLYFFLHIQLSILFSQFLTARAKLVCRTLNSLVVVVVECEVLPDALLRVKVALFKKLSMLALSSHCETSTLREWELQKQDQIWIVGEGSFLDFLELTRSITSAWDGVDGQIRFLIFAMTFLLVSDTAGTGFSKPISTRDGIFLGLQSFDNPTIYTKRPPSVTAIVPSWLGSPQEFIRIQY